MFGLVTRKDTQHMMEKPICPFKFVHLFIYIHVFSTSSRFDFDFDIHINLFAKQFEIAKFASIRFAEFVIVYSINLLDAKSV